MTVMQKVCGLFLTLLVAIFVLLCLHSTVCPQDTRLYLDFEKQRLSASIKNTPLKAVLEEIKDERNIWFETGFMRDSSLLDDDISVQFRNLRVQNGLERILSGINHSLIFKGNNVVGVMLFGKPGKRTYRGRRTIRRTSRRR